MVYSVWGWLRGCLLQPVCVVVALAVAARKHPAQPCEAAAVGVNRIGLQRIGELPVIPALVPVPRARFSLEVTLQLPAVLAFDPAKTRCRPGRQSTLGPPNLLFSLKNSFALLSLATQPFLDAPAFNTRLDFDFQSSSLRCLDLYVSIRIRSWYCLSRSICHTVARSYISIISIINQGPLGIDASSPLIVGDRPLYSFSLGLLHMRG